jgi:uncharacterized SAM-binding protein YcdF (DUF218 family)
MNAGATYARCVARCARRAPWLVPMLAVLVMLLACQAAALRFLGSFLVVDEPLEPAAAIVVLAGQMPQREVEAAAIYRNGWAPRVVLVPGADAGEIQPHGALNWQVRRGLLIALGVPAEAITVAAGHATNTLEELELARRTISSESDRVILVSSNYHTRRVLSAWELTAPGLPRPIIRVAQDDLFDPNSWWRHAQSRATVVHEYLGLLELGWRRVSSEGLDTLNP